MALMPGRSVGKGLPLNKEEAYTNGKFVVIEALDTE